MKKKFLCGALCFQYCFSFASLSTCRIGVHGWPLIWLKVRREKSGDFVAGPTEKWVR